MITTATHPTLTVEHIEKVFTVGTQQIKVLKDISFTVPAETFAVLVGPSGCGKSTLLHVILGLEPPTRGKINLLGKDIYQGTTEDDRSTFRKKHVGMVYQQANWIKSLNVIENVAFPLLLLGKTQAEAHQAAEVILKKVKMSEWSTHHPFELSGGQQQRAALARALVHDPEIIIADEPTGNLDFQSGQEIMELLQSLNTQHHKTVIMVTHDLEYLKYCQLAIRLFDGQLDEIYEGNQITSILNELKTKRGTSVTPSTPQIHVESI